MTYGGGGGGAGVYSGGVGGSGGGGRGGNSEGEYGEAGMPNTGGGFGGDGYGGGGGGGTGIVIFAFRTQGAACFLAGTPVLTPAGYKPIESIAEGDLIQTADGRAVPVSGASKQEIRRAVPSNAPYFIPAGSLGHSIPCSDLVMSPGHCVQVSVTEDLWLPAWKCGELSAAVKQIHLDESFTYYNLMLPSYFTDNLVVFDGVVVESMGPRHLEYEETKGAYRRLPSRD